MMRLNYLPLLLAAAPALGGCTSMADTSLDRVGEATLTFADGRSAGVATLHQDSIGLRITVAASGLTPGDHGFHLHTTGKCEGPGFTSAGGHLNPANRKHGSQAVGGAHLGDLPNLNVNANGSASVTVSVVGGRSALGAIFDGDGTAVVIHDRPDDYRTDPTGGAGDRVACGVFRRTA